MTQRITILFTLLIFGILPNIALCSDASDGQHNTRYFLGTGIGYSATLLHDSGMSPLNYNGDNLRSTVYFLRNAPHSVFENSFLMDYGGMNSRFTSSRPVVNVYLYNELTYLRKLTTNLPVDLRLWAGASLPVFFGSRTHLGFVNNDFHYDFAAILTPRARLDKPFTFSDLRFTASLDASFSLISYSIRPSFNNSLASGFLQEYDSPAQALLRSGTINSPTNLFFTQTVSSLNWHLANNNQIRLKYHWHFYSIKGFNDMMAGSHSIMISTLFSFQ